MLMIRLLRSHVVYPLLAGERYKGIHRLCRSIREFEDLPPQQQMDQQWSKLKGLLQHAYDTVPYYRETMDAHGLPLAAIRSMDDYRRLPELGKETIRARRSDLVSKKFPLDGLRSAHTSGTTSTPMTFYRDLPGTRWKTALQLRLNEWCQFRLGDRSLWLWGAQFDFVQKPSWKWSMLETYGFGTWALPVERLEDATFARFVRVMQRCRPRIVYGYSNMVDMFSQYVLRNHCDLPRPEAVICTAEPLGAVRKQNIQEALQAPVYDHYGSRELGMIAANNAGNTKMRFHGAGCLVELVPVQRMEEGWIARLVVTDLLNEGMPFLRYDTADSVLVQDADLAANSAFPVVDQIHGRQQDTLVLSDGRLFPGMFMTVALWEVRDQVSIKCLQFVQEAIGKMTLRYVADGPWETTLAELNQFEKILRSTIPDRFDLRFEAMEEMPRSASGKFSLVVSKVPTPSVRATAIQETALAGMERP
jgi:phenylacetate-CoA ligase